MKIVIAEDDENSRLLLESILLSLGHTVTTATDGENAWGQIKEETPDLVITDILMPGIDGFELCRRIRSESRFNAIPIIIYSATYIDRKDEELALAVGANRFVVKPIEPIAMVQIINEVIAVGTGKSLAARHRPAAELDAMHIERLQAKLRRKLIQIGRERSALRASEERLRLALEAAELGVFEWRLDTNEFNADENVNFLFLGSHGPLHTQWRDLLSFIHPDDRSELAGVRNRLLTAESLVAVTCRFSHPEGRTHWIELHAKRMPDENFASPPRVVGVIKDITREQSLTERLHKTVSEFDHLVRHDALTSLPNRLMFNDMLDRTLNTLTTESGSTAIMLLDVDGFQVINDSRGHALGDALLVLLAQRIQTSLHPGDIVARIGGDEFAIIANGISDQEGAANIANNILFAINAPIELNGESLTVSASIGIARIPEDGDDRHTLLKAADTAMFAAKAQGRNRYCFHTEAMSVRANELHSVEQGLKRALEQNHLRVYYQPQVNLISGELLGVEALVRWQHPTEGLIPPIRFIPIAEANGLIDPLGRWVLRAACAECVSWIVNYPAEVRLSVNVSARQLVNENFVNNLYATLLETSFPPERLELELTESTLQLVETSPRLLDEIKRLGVSIAIDDFGTGYSSLSVLKTLPIDRLKIDRSFVRDIPADGNDIAIVEAIIGISRTLGLSIIAEGVETTEQRVILQKLGCEAGQGYLFSRPLPPAELEQWLQNTAHST